MEKINSIKLPDGITYAIEDANALTKQQITNCLLEVPQRIKYTFEGALMTIKAGSVVIVPNGSGVFTEKVITSDMSRELNNGNLMAFEDGGGGLDYMLREYCFSGSTAPTSFQDGLYAVWYDTANNIVKRTGDAGATWTTGYSLPLFTADVNNNFQIFNGFGYIGSTVFVTKGVKGLVPNGRNADGSLKNIEFTTDRVLVHTVNVTDVKRVSLIVSTNNTLASFFSLINSETQPSQIYRLYYKASTNEIRVVTETNTNFKITGFVIGDIITQIGGINSFIPKLPFRAVDYSDKSEVASWSFPSKKYIELAVGASGSTYTSPSNGLFCAYCSMTNTNAFLDMNVDGIYNVRIRDAAWNSADIAQIIPAKKGGVFTLQYSGVNFLTLRFIYADGEV